MRQKKDKPNIFKGLWFAWADPKPFTSEKKITDGHVGHTNKTYHFVSKRIWVEHSDFIFNNAFFWKVQAQVVFSGAKHGQKDKIELIEIETNERYRFNELTRTVKREIVAALRSNKNLEEGHKNKGIFHTIKFYAEIIRI